MNIPIPAYLIAIVSGDLEERQVGKWTFVIADPVDIAKAMDELD